MVDNSGLIGGGGLETTVSLEAGENMSIGDLWFLGADGKAYKLRDEFTSNVGSTTLYPAALAAGQLLNSRFVVDSTANKILVYGRSNPGNIYAGIVQVNSTTGELTINSWTDLGVTSIGNLSGNIKIGANKCLILTKTSSNLQGVIVDYSGTTPTGAAAAVTPTNCTSTSTSSFDIAYDSTNDKVLFVFTETTGSFNVKAIVGNISGTTLTWGAIETIDSTTYSTGSDIGKLMYDPAEDKFIVVYRTRPTGDSQIRACTVDCSAASISVGSITTIFTDTASGNSHFLDSAVGKEFAKLPNGNYLAFSYFDYTQAKVYACIVKVSTGTSNISTTQAELRDGGSNKTFSEACPLITVGSTGDFLVGVTSSSTDYLYKLNYDGSTLTNDGSIYSGNVNVFNANIINSTGDVVLHQIERNVGVTDDNTIQVFDLSVSDSALGYYDFEVFGTSMPYIQGTKLDIQPGEIIKSANGVAIISYSNSYRACIVTDQGKIMKISALGVVNQAVTLGQTYKFPLKLIKQGNKPLSLASSGIRPPSSLYASGESLNWYASNNTDEDFNSQYIGYCLTDDTLVVNSNSSKET